MAKKNTIFNFPHMKGGEEEVMRGLKSDPDSYLRYLKLNKEWKSRFLDFCTGKKTLPLTYDPFFKRIFNPEIHPRRLSRFLSCLLGIPVKVVRTLPLEETMLDGSVLMIMDILVELEDGSYANVEIQKIPYAFLGERISCYSSDLVLRQYSRVKGENGEGFTYRDMKKVYTIVIFEKSTGIFHELPEFCIHKGKTVFDTGLKMELLQEYCLVALDVFRDIPYPKIRSEQTAWLSLLATEDTREAEELVVEYPWLEEIYEEMAGLMHNPGEVLNMFSDALHKLDQNTVQYMIEELEKEKQEETKRRAAAEEEKEEEAKRREAAEEERQKETRRRQEAENLLKEKERQLAELKELLEKAKKFP